jgi:hypothetical protein
MKIIKENYTMKWFEFIDEKLIHHEVTNEYSIALTDDGKIKNITNELGSSINEGSEVFEYFSNKYNG